MSSRSIARDGGDRTNAVRGGRVHGGTADDGANTGREGSRRSYHGPYRDSGTVAESSADGVVIPPEASRRAVSDLGLCILGMGQIAG